MKYTAQQVSQMNAEDIAELLNQCDATIESLNQLKITLIQQKEDWKKWFKELEEENEAMKKTLEELKSAINKVNSL